jgi:SAM-dependent methyltransferase
MLPPLPPRRLRQITAAPDLEEFLWTGIVDLAKFMDLYRDFDIRVKERVRILGSGCGCGRLTRFFQASRDAKYAKWKVYGSDINAESVECCARNLPDIITLKNGVTPPLVLPEGGVDLVFAFSVFTHLPEQAANGWLAEMHRVLDD